MNIAYLIREYDSKIKRINEIKELAVKKILWIKLNNFYDKISKDEYKAYQLNKELGIELKKYGV